MSRIDDLITEFCPTGVQFRPMDEVLNFRRGRQLKAAERVDGNFPIVTASRTESHSHFESNHGANSVTITSHGAYAGHVNFWRTPIWLANNVFLLEPKSSSLDSRFLYFWLKNIEDQIQGAARAGGIPYINSGDISQFVIPNLPLTIQVEIVRILDAFMELEAELEEELETRRKQYEFYRDQLLTFTDEADVAWLTVGSLFDIRNGYTPSKSESTNWTNGELPWFRVEDIRQNGRLLNKAIQFVSHAAVKGAGPFTANSLLVSTSATIGEYALVTVPHLSNQRFASLAVKHEHSAAVHGGYLLHLGHLISKGCKDGASDAGNFASISNDKLKRIVLPLPSLQRQASISADLDGFDALVNDISVGLPAELAARRKQYEYYRDKLLTFPEKVSS
jgi:type I restriction enzyme S subunit